MFWEMTTHRPAAGRDHSRGQYAFFDYTAKYTPGASKEVCPARVDDATTKRAQEIALTAHRALHCRGYSRTDMIVKGGDIYVLETNTIPGMTATSLFPQAARAYGRNSRNSWTG